MRKLIRAATVAAGSLLFVGGAVALAPGAGALVPPSGLVNAPEYCLQVYGDPAPCPPPERPKPVDQRCLRVDIDPLYCQYQP
ncbi:MAG: hypothetical protein HYZ59_01520 [Actinobacteria bacterium]|nr:hypothetical protein [Actinomycetota bacterium]